MRTIKVPSRSELKFRTVTILENLDGTTTYRCDCPANTWFRVSEGRHGKENCRHIQFVIEHKL
jgi:hypothetical protein